MSMTLTKAMETVLDAAKTQTCLTPELRLAMEMVATKASYNDGDKDEIQSLKRLIQHCDIYSGYPRCGYQKMDSDEKQLFDAVVSENLYGEDVED